MRIKIGHSICIRYALPRAIGALGVGLGGQERDYREWRAMVQDERLRRQRLMDREDQRDTEVLETWRMNLYPLVVTNIAMENRWPIEIDGLPSYKMVIVHGYVK